MPGVRGAGPGHRPRPRGAGRPQQDAQRGRDPGARLHPGRVVRADLHRVRPGPRGRQGRRLHRPAAAGLPLPRADEGQDPRHQPHLRGTGPQGAEEHPDQGPGLRAAAHRRLHRPSGHLRTVPVLRRHPAQRGRAIVQDRRDQHRRRLRHADQRPGRVRPPPDRTGGRAAGRHAAADPGLAGRDRARLPQPRAQLGLAVRGRGPAGQDGPPPRLTADRRHLRLRRADGRPASARHRPDEQPAGPAAGQGQHRPGGGAQAGDDLGGRPCGRSRARCRHQRRDPAVRGHRGRPTQQRHPHRPASRRPGPAEDPGAYGHRRAAHPRRHDPQPAGGRRRRAARG